MDDWRNEKITLFDRKQISSDYGSVDKKKFSTKSDERINESGGIFKIIFNLLTRCDKFLFIVAVIFSIICGICPPILGYYFGAMTNLYVRHALQQSLPPEQLNFTTTVKPEYVGRSTEFYKKPIFKNDSTAIYELVSVIRTLFQKNITSYNVWSTKGLHVPVSDNEFHETGNIFAAVYLYLGSVLFISTFLQSIFWELLSKRITRRLQTLLHDQLIKQEISWHALDAGGDSRTKLVSKLRDVENVIKEDFGSIVHRVSAFVSGLFVGLSVNPRLTLVTTVIIGPFLFAVSGYMTKLTKSAESNPGGESKINNSNRRNLARSKYSTSIEINRPDERIGIIEESDVSANISRQSKQSIINLDSIKSKSNYLRDTVTSKLTDRPKLSVIDNFGNRTTDNVGEIVVTPVNVSGFQYYGSTKDERLANANESEIIVDEVLSNVKTVTAYGKQSSEIDRYKKNLNDDFRKMSNTYRRIAICIGVSNTLQFFSYCLTFAYGSYLIQSGISTPGTVFTIFFSIISSSFSIVDVFPSINTIRLTSADTSSVVEVIKRETRIDPYSSTGLKLIRIQGFLEFRNVSFSYPILPPKMVLRDININFEPGKLIALVGCGESDIFGLFELIVRHYEPTGGQICLDDVPLSNFNLSWLRKQISIISKKSVLFNLTIAENIRCAKDDCSFEEIEQAARLADVEEFISNLPKRYDTLVNDEEVSLTKVEKRKIAIARSLVLNRKILLFDEADDVFNDEEDRKFLQLLESLSKVHTVVVIPHRVQMAQFASYIYVIKDGYVAENGTHVELLQKEGLYAHMLATVADFESSAFNKESEATFENLTERVELEKHEKPIELLKKYNDNDDEYDVKFRMPGLDESDIESVDEPESDLDDDGPWRVLRRSVSEEALNDGNDDDYETIVTHVREKRLIKYNDEDEDEKLEQPGQDVIKIPNEDDEEVFQLESVDVKKPVVSLPSSVKVRSTPTPGSPKLQHKDVEPTGSILDIWTLQKPEWLCLVLVFVCCIVVGFIPPFVAFYYGKVYQIYALVNDDSLKNVTVKWSCIFLILSISFGITLWLQAMIISKTSDLLIKRMKLLMFENIIRHPICWFDASRLSSKEALKKHLIVDIPLIKPLSIANIGRVLTYLTTIVSSLIIGYEFGRILTAELFIFVPIVICLSYIERVLLEKKRNAESQYDKNSLKITGESIDNINTIHELGQEKRFTDLYNKWVKLSYRKDRILTVLCSLMHSIIQSIIVYLYSLGFKLGNHLVEENKMTTSGVYMVYFAVCFCVAALCKCFACTRDYVKAKQLSGSLLYLLKKKPDIDENSIYGAKPIINGNVSFHNVTFTYPSNPDVKALDSVNLTLNAGKLYAMYGEPKGGMSAIGDLIERFYDPDDGSVYVDNYEMRTLNVSYLRDHIGVVSQEPVILDRSIRDNIAYGSISTIPNDGVSLFEIEKAAKLANVHNFIVNLPQGYDTSVGTRGIQLSIDQKQRIAIARAIVRNPKILILDDPTFMLDAESTKIIQRTLDNVRRGRTTIIISRNLDVVRNADLIYVIYKGRVLEQGRHEELIEKGGYYSRVQVI